MPRPRSARDFAKQPERADPAATLTEGLGHACPRQGVAPLVSFVLNSQPPRSARVEGLCGRMSGSGRQVEGLFESVLSESFGETRWANYVLRNCTSHFTRALQ